MALLISGKRHSSLRLFTSQITTSPFARSQLAQPVAMSRPSPLKLTAITLQEPWAIRSLDLCVRDMASLSAAARILVEHLTGR